MRQALHIFKKDARCLWRERTFILLLDGVFAWVNPWWLAALLLAASGYLIARLVHAEAIPGDRQFWITRPYRWSSLLGAKLLFVVVFVNLPILLAQIIRVSAAGFPLLPCIPGLLWSQFLILLLGSLPVIALAALTAGIVPFIFSTLILVTVWYSMETPILFSAEIRKPLWPGGIEWIRETVVVAGLAAALLCILYVLYRKRRTFLGRVVAVAGTVIAAVAYWYLPWAPAWALQSRLAKQTVENSALRLSVDRNGIEFRPRKANTWENVEVRLPLTVTGVPDALDVRMDAADVRLQAPDGRIWKSSLGGAMRHAAGPGTMRLDVTTTVDLPFFNWERQQAVTIRGSVYLTLFGNHRAATIPLSHTPVNALDGLRCHLGIFDQFFCDAAFGWPARLVYARFGEITSPLTESVSYSPFPSGLHLDPVETRWAPSLPRSAREVTVEVEEPLAHVRRNFEIQGVRMEASLKSE
jgi:hypothetical protein